VDHLPIRAFVSFIALPGIFTVLAPPLVAVIDPWKKTLWGPGGFVMMAGAAILFWCVYDFLVGGKGTLAPWDPPKRLVMIGPYRWMRNPMYAGVLLLVLGWGLFLSSPLLFFYTIMLAVGFHLRVVKYEEPWLKAQFGEQWEAYRREVPRWWPRRIPRQRDE
jgi:protein-S-isoprenylcysteine O-methyltransferase Ste14